MITFFGLAHTLDATQLMGCGGVGGGDDSVRCSRLHGRCCAICWMVVGGGDVNVP